MSNRTETPVQAHLYARRALPVRGIVALLAAALLWILFLSLADGVAQSPPAQAEASGTAVSGRIAPEGRFLSRRGWQPGGSLDRRIVPQQTEAVAPLGGGSSSATWTALGPSAIVTPHYGLVSGRISAIALDPADATGNHLYIGTTGGGVWSAQNAAASTVSQIVFQPLTDNLSALGGAWDASISIGAITVQPGGTGVILAGTGDPNQATDSYYGAGILRSADGGATWSLIARTTDVESSLSGQNYSFAGEGFAGFAWSTANPQIVVAALSQAYEGTLVDAVTAQSSTQGLYYSTDSGASWHLATITDGNGADVQGPLDRFPSPDGNAATSVVWNPIRKLFLAAVRYHGYYQSFDGVTWTRLSNQPGTGLTAAKCPTNTGSTGSIACPIFRGALAVNPVTGDTFAWTVDLDNQDQGLWQDLCGLTSGVCTNGTVSFGRQWSTAALESSTKQGSATIADGVYNLALAAVPVPSQQVTEVFAGATDLWQTSCPVSLGCTWRNTTNAATCFSAQVGPFQHAIEWNRGNAAEVFLGNDSGLWRSTDLIAETGSPCSASDATHFQNLNGQLENKDGSAGSLAEPESLSAIVTTPYTLLAGFGANGAAGVKAGAVTADWPQVLGGYGGPVAIDPSNSSNWYVNDQAGAAIYRCSQLAPCAPADFGTSPVVTNADVSGDGNAMAEPAPFLVDPLDSTELLIASCRVWRGPASGVGWVAGDAISPIFDTGATTGACAGDAMIRALAVAQVSASSEVIYAGTYGSANGGGLLPGHVLSATYNRSLGTMPAWHDLTLNPVANDSRTLNYFGYDISSVVIDPHNTSTVYVTVEAANTAAAQVQSVYRSTDGGATWNSIAANLPDTPVSALVVDPGNANTVYAATDQGVYYTTGVAGCSSAQSKCWSGFGSGLPQAPVVALTAAPQTAVSQVLVAATYGRGIWQSGLASAGGAQGSASVSPSSLAFPATVFGTASAALAVTLANTGQVALTPTSISMSGNAQDFSATGCSGQTVAVGGSCTIQVTFTPQATGPRTATMTIFANVYGGQLTVDLNGTGLAGANVLVTPSSLSFGTVEDGATSATQPAQLQNLSTSTTVSISNVAVTAPFVLASNSCTATLGTSASCQVTVAFAPVQAGAVSGLLTFTDSAGTQTVQLNGTGAAAPTDTLSPTSLTFAATASGQVSAAQTVTITNAGGLPLTITSIAASANFQQSSNCLSGVAAGAQCAIGVSFAPTAAGAITGTLTIVDALGTRTVALSGTGLQPGALSVSPASLSFSTQQAGVTSAPQTVTITNTGGSPIASIGFQLTGAAAAQYTAANSTCGAQLGAGAQCTVQVSFTPAATGPIAAALNISSSTAGVTAVQVPLNGSGLLAAGLSVSPTPVTFSTAIAVGQPSSAQLVTVTNSSGYAISSVALAATAPFSISANGCTGQLAAGASCVAGVVFQPVTSGAASGTLTVTSPVVTAPATAGLTGTGFDFTVAPSGSSSITVSSGQQADFRLVITPAGAQGSFTFACGTLPTNAICIFNPTTVPLGAGVQGNVLVQIYTGSSGLVMRGEPALFGARWPVALAVLALPFALWRRHRLLLATVLAVVAMGGIVSCTAAIGGSGGTSGSGSTSATPAGTYSVPVTVTSTGISHSTTLTLTVD